MRTFGKIGLISCAGCLLPITQPTMSKQGRELTNDSDPDCWKSPTGRTFHDPPTDTASTTVLYFVCLQAKSGVEIESTELALAFPLLSKDNFSSQV